MTPRIIPMVADFAEAALRSLLESEEISLFPVSFV